MANRKDIKMTRVVPGVKHNQAPLKSHWFELAMTSLLAICAVLLGVCAALMWSYLPAITESAKSSIVTKQQAESEAALSELRKQQALANTKLDAIRDELRALNEKAEGAARVTPPSQSTP